MISPGKWPRDFQLLLRKLLVGGLTDSREGSVPRNLLLNRSRTRRSLAVVWKPWFQIAHGSPPFAMIAQARVPCRQRVTSLSLQGQAADGSRVPAQGY